MPTTTISPRVHKYRATPVQREHREQAALFQWAAFQKKQYPELEMLFAIPNGGHRHIVVAQKLKEEGVKPGVPDCFLGVARCGYHGFFLELKVGTNRLTDEQKKWRDALKQHGYYWAICWSWETAAAELVRYLEENVEHA